MSLKTKRILLTAFLLVFAGAAGFAQSENTDEPAPEFKGSPYDTGDQIFALHLGGIAPLFSIDPNTGDFTPFTDHLMFGGCGYIEWGSYLNNNMILGIEFGGLFSETPNRVLYSIPVTAKFTYVTHTYPLEIPFSAGLGFGITKLQDQTYFGPIVKLGGGIRFAIKGDWALGVITQGLFVPEFYFDEEKADKSRIGTFLEICLSAVYHF